MQKEARIIIPYADTADHAKALDYTFKRIAARFGGYTSYSGDGGWFDPKEGLIAEPITVIDIAYTPSLENDTDLYHFAQDVRHDFKQKSVYLRYGNGVVQFVDAKSMSLQNGGEYDLDVMEFGNVMEAMNTMTSEDQKITARIAAFHYLFKRSQAHEAAELTKTVLQHEQV